ncbi:MAG: hypothetical protein AB7G23_08945 [Vicinamibacterales bacterium]
MLPAGQALAALPVGLRDPLIKEYNSIVSNYFEHRWSPAELSGGLFCEIVFTILDGNAKGRFAAKPSKPANFVQACRALENNAGQPRSFQILIPRLLPALYEIRNNRGVGHVGGDVDPNHIDATAVLTTANWVMAELVRVFHSLPIADAQRVVDALVERRSPLVWEVGVMKRVLATDMGLQDQVLVLAHTCSTTVTVERISEWTEYRDHGYLRRLLRRLHSSRLLELNEASGTLELLPPGTSYVQNLIAQRLSAAGHKPAAGKKKTRKRKR